MKLKSACRIGILSGIASLAIGALLFLAISPVDGGGKKMPIPAPQAQKEAKELVKELYGKEYKQAERNADEKSKLALTLLQEARDTKDFPAGRYVLLQEARDLAVEASDVSTALQAIEELALSFQMDADKAFAMKVQALNDAAKIEGTQDSQRSVIEAALLLLEESLAEDNFDAAGKLIQAAEQAAKNLRSVPVLSSVRKRGEEIKHLQQAYAKVKDSVDKLKTAPDDGKANLEVGKYQAFFKGNWGKGLPLLAKGSDESLKKLANLDLDNPKEPAKQAALGTGWKKSAEELQGISQIHVFLRAYHWLQQAEFRVKDKQAQEQIRQMIHEIMTKVPVEYHMGEIVSEIRQFSGHRGPVFGVAISPDNRKVATASQDATIRIWDAKTGQLMRTLSGHGGPVWTVAFSPDSRWVASGSFDNTIRLWDLVSGRSIRTFQGHTDYVRSVAFSEDGEHILSGSDDNTVRLWKVATGEEALLLKGHNHFVMSVAIAADGKKAVSGSLDRTIRLWDLNSGKSLQTFTGHRDTVLSVAISPDGGRILSGSSDKTLRLWDAETGKTIHLLEGHKGFVTSVAFSPDGRRAISGSYDKSLRLWDLQSGSEIRTLPGHNDIVWSVGFSSDGRWAVSASQDRIAKLWGGAK